MLLAPRIVAATGDGGGGDGEEALAALGSLAQALLLARAAQVKKVSNKRDRSSPFAGFRIGFGFPVAGGARLAGIGVAAGARRASEGEQ